MNAKDYLTYLQLKARQSKSNLSFTSLDLESHETISRIRRAKSLAYGDNANITNADMNLLREVANQPPWMQLDPLAKSIHAKSMRLVSTQDQEKLGKTVIGFLPTGIINACCIGGLQNGYIIALNFGLFYTFTLLCIALYAADTRGELLQDALESVYPEDILKAAIDCALKPNPETYKVLEQHYSYMTPELLGLGGVGLSGVLQFVHLHEVGHISNGDTDKGLAQAIFDFQNLNISYIKANFGREYAADKYALNAYLNQTTDSVSAWAQFSHIETFFLFLTYVERARKSEASETHPPAIERLRRLREIVKQDWGNDKVGFTKTIGVRFEYIGRIKE